MSKQHICYSVRNVKKIKCQHDLDSAPALSIQGNAFAGLITDQFLYLRASTGAPPLHISLTFERTVASCTPLVAFVPLNWLSPVVPRSCLLWLKSHLMSPIYGTYATDK